MSLNSLIHEFAGVLGTSFSHGLSLSARAHDAVFLQVVTSELALRAVGTILARFFGTILGV